MLRTYLNSDEKVLFYNCVNNGKRYKLNDLFMLFMGILFLIISLVAVFLVISWDIIFSLLLIVSLVFSFVFFYIFNKNNINFLNNKLSFEYAITNQRVLLYDYETKKLYSFPLTNYDNFYVDEKTVHLSNSSASIDAVPIIDNNKISFSRRELVLYKIRNPYMIIYKIQTALYVATNNIDDIYDISKYLEFNEVLLFRENKFNYSFLFNKKHILFFIIAFLFVISIFFIDNTLTFYIIVLFLLSSKPYIKSQIAFIKYKNKVYNFSYAITSKRVLFLDCNENIFYSFPLNICKKISVCNYDKNNDIGDIVFSNQYLYDNFNVFFHSRSKIRGLEERERIFPEHIENFIPRTVFFNNCLNMKQIRLYGVNKPYEVIRNLNINIDYK